MISLHSNDVLSKCAIRDRLERDMESFLAKGGKARQVQGFTQSKTVMSFADQNRAAWNRKVAIEKGEWS